MVVADEVPAWDTPAVDKVEFYRDAAGEWRWRFVRKNGEPMADSGEGYQNKVDCVAAAEYLFKEPKRALAFSFEEA